MVVKLGSCPSCRHPIYKEEGPPDACDCDEGVWETLRLREATPKPRTASQKTPNRNGEVLPELDITMFMSPSARAEMEGARGISMSSSVARTPELDDAALGSMWDEGGLIVADGGLDFEFTTGDDIDFPQAPADRPGRYRVDQGAPPPQPWRRDMTGGPSDGRVVGRVGQGIGQATRPAPRPIYSVGQEGPVGFEPPPRAPAQESRVVAVTNRREAQVLPVRPVRPVKVPTALERLGSVDVGDDPFS